MKKSTYRAEHPTQHEKREYVFSILKQSLKSDEGCQLSLSPEVWENLTLYCGSLDHREKHISHQLNRSVTELGTIALIYRLAQPTSDAALLTQRQQFINYFRTHPKLTQQFTASCKLFKNRENVIASFWNSWFELSEIEDKTEFPPIIPKNSVWIKKQPLLVTLLTARNAVQDSYFLTLGIGGALALIASGLYRLHQGTEAGLHHQIDTLAAQHQHNGLFMEATWFLNSQNNQLKGLLHLASGVGILLGIQYKKRGLEWILYTNKSIHFYVLAASCLMHSLKTTYDLLKEMGEQPMLPELEPLITFFETTVPADEELKLLVSNLLSYSPTQQPRMFNYIGKGVQTASLFIKHLATFTKPLIAFGHVDMYAGLAKLLDEQADKPLQFCFPDYVQAPRPLIESNHFWHPLVESQHATSNSLLLGNHTQLHHALITGRNTGGKSTLLKALTLNILMGQTLGIAAASSLRFTPFASIETYMNVRDDISGGASLFKNQVIRAKQLYDRTIECDQHGTFSFTVFDEPCNGTDPRAGSALAYHTAQKLCTIPSCITLIASHYPRMKYLETATKLFATYRMSSAEPLFKLERQEPFTHELIRSVITPHEQEDIEEVFKVLRSVGYPETIIQAAEADLGLTHQ